MAEKYFQATVKFLQEQENGKIKKVTVKYLVDSMTCTEAEARVVKHLGTGMTDYEVTSVVESSISEVIES